MTTWVFRELKKDGRILRFTYMTPVIPELNETATAYHARVLAHTESKLLHSNFEV